jgi:predicted ATPase
VRIQSIQLANFKRFKKLKIDGLKSNHRIVFLLGPNGCGKSSLLEAFNCCRAAATDVYGFDQCFHVRKDEDNIEIEKLAQDNKARWGQVLQGINIRFHSMPDPNWLSPSGWEQNAFILRGAHRNVSDHRSTQLMSREQLDNTKTSASVLRRSGSPLEINYQRLLHHQQRVLANPDVKPDDEVGQEALRPFRILQKSVGRVFPGVELVGLGDPMANGTFVFRRDGGPKYRFSVLSAGEESVFELLLDIVVNRESVKETVYCIDEPEIHTHSALQSRLMDELCNVVPPNWQLWIATHSAGMVRWAMSKLASDPDSVAFLDLDQQRDAIWEIQPVKPTKSFWSRQFAVAVGDLAELIVPDELILCEGDKNKSTGFDAAALQRIFGDSHPKSAFVSAGGGSEVKSTGAALLIIKEKVAPAMSVRRLYDRDDRTDEEVSSVRQSIDSVLRRRELENYLFDFEILERLVAKHGKDGDWQEIKLEIQDELRSLTASPRNKSPDDVKSAAPRIHLILKRKLQIEQAGSNYEAFALTHLIPLIDSSTNVFRELESEIWHDLS